MAVTDRTFENPLSGERIIIRQGGSDTAGELLAWELELAVGGRVPSSHAHPEQEERFTVLDGRMKFRVGRRRVVLGPGESVCIPPGTVHHFANAGRVPAHMAVETRPALDMEEMLAVAAAMAREQHAAHRLFPRPLDLALFMREFEREVRAPYIPGALQRTIGRGCAWLARVWGRDQRYHRIRES